MRKYIFVIDGDKVTAEGVGVHGKICTKETDKLLAGLNPKLVERKLKKEYNEEKIGQSISG